MAKYRKKAVEIEAFRFGYDKIPNWNNFNKKCEILPGDMPLDSIIEIKTLEGTMTGKFGDYIIKGIKGEFYPCRADIFAETYERVENKEYYNDCSPEEIDVETNNNQGKLIKMTKALCIFNVALALLNVFNFINLLFL